MSKRILCVIACLGACLGSGLLTGCSGGGGGGGTGAPTSTAGGSSTGGRDGEGSTGGANTGTTGSTVGGTGTATGTATGTTTGAAIAADDALPPASTTSDPAATLPATTAATQASTAAQVRMVGRVDDSNVVTPMALPAGGGSAAGLQLAWPGSGVAMAFHGTQLALTMANLANFSSGIFSYYDVVVDGNPPVVIKVQSGSAVYPISDRLAPGNHTVVLTKRSEEQFGVDLFQNFLIDASGTYLPPPPAAARRMEFIGDSITAGFGVLGTDPTAATCYADSRTEDASLSYAALTAAAVGADYTNLAFSGKGLIRNRDPVGDPTRTMPYLWQRVLPVGTSSILTERSWDFSRYTPQVVVINLGTNDLKAPTTAVPVLTTAQLTAGYVAFIAQVRAQYPGVTIFCVVGPELSGSLLTQARQAIQGPTVQSDAKIIYVEFPQDSGQNADGTSNWGCSYHPARTTQQRMATQLTTAVKAAMGW